MFSSKFRIDCRVILPALAFLFLSTATLRAQQDDFGIWAGVVLKHKITQRLSASLEEQIRLDHNASAIAQHFTEAGIDFSPNKNFKFGINYRFSNNFQKTYYSKRHRVNVDLSYKTKFSKIRVMFRTRVQEQQKDIRSSETGRYPEWYSRNKLSLQLDLNKKYAPYLSAEAFYLIAAPGAEGGFINKMRYAVGVEYEFNRVHAFDLFYLMQKEQNVVNPITDFVAGISYAFSF